MILLLKLILAHILGDFVLQPEKWVKQKELRKLKAPQLYLHVLLHTALVLVFVADLHFWKAAVLLGVLHFIIDTIKLYVQKNDSRRFWFFTDQLAHLLCIVAVWYYYEPQAATLLASLYNEQNLVLLTAYIFVTSPASLIIKMIISRWQPDKDVKSAGTQQAQGTFNTFSMEPDAVQPRSLQEAGRYIGILERLFILTFILLNHWEAVGFLIAAKSVFRFSDLKEAKDRKLTEYILIGTLVSFGIAILTGLMVMGLTR